MCLNGKTQLLCMQCRGIRPNLVAREKSHGFSRVAAGTWVIFSSYDGGKDSKESWWPSTKLFNKRVFQKHCLKILRDF